MKYLDIFLDHVKKKNGRKILDVGCGNGRDAKYMSERGFEVIKVLKNKSRDKTWMNFLCRRDEE